MEKWTSAQWAEVGHIILSLRLHCTDRETDKLFFFFPFIAFLTFFKESSATWKNGLALFSNVNWNKKKNPNISAEHRPAGWYPKVSVRRNYLNRFAIKVRVKQVGTYYTRLMLQLQLHIIFIIYYFHLISFHLVLVCLTFSRTIFQGLFQEM